MTTLEDEAIKLLDRWEAIARDKNRYIAALEAKIDRQNAEIAELKEKQLLVSIDDVLTAASPSKPECTHVFEWLNHNPSNQHCIHCGKIA